MKQQPNIEPKAPQSPGRTPNPNQQPLPALLRALEQAPTVQIPADFASRVASLALTQAPRPASRWTDAIDRLRHLSGGGSVAGRVTTVSGVLLLAALFVLAPHTTPTFLDLRFDMELLLLAELGGVSYLLARLYAR